MNKLKIEYIPIAELKAYVNNAKEHPAEQVEQIKKSILEFGMNDPIAVWKDNVIIEGHGRLLACAELGEPYDVVPVIRLDYLSDEERKAYALVHNKLTMNSGFDIDMLNIELDNIIDIDMSEFGFDIQLEQEKEIIEDEDPEQVETRTKSGDLYALGNHRLICGDSTDITAIERLMGGVKASLLLTDPPYGIDVVKGSKIGGDKAFGKVGGGGQTKFGKVGGGNIVKSKTYSAIIGDDTTDTARANYEVALTCTENQIIFGGNYFTDFLPPSRCWIVWDKQNTGNFADAELAWTSFNKGVKLYHFLWNGLCREGSREVEGKTRVHPTQKPVGMLADILKDFSEENDSILDCFGGSGSTLIACEQLNRKCYMAELDPHYCDVIIQRWENFTGGKAEKIT